MKPFILGKKFSPKVEKNKMMNVGKVLESREDFIKRKPNNLYFLLEKRYSWMNKYIPEDNTGIEVGCGNGLSKLFIKSKNYLLTDYSDYYWVDQKVDALDLPYKENSLDFIVSSNMIHHIATPYKFFAECKRVLKPNGLIIIQEVNASFFMRLILKIMNHEGYDYDVDPFDENAVCNDPTNLWSGNNALPNLIFDNKEKFEATFDFKFIKDTYSEFLVFIISGGVTAKTKTLNIPKPVLIGFYCIDKLLMLAAKNIFALQRQIVLQKNDV
jgi:ubiquinone/menaquinone biosynthesis C-methylase UbiE